jgi:hypothetical protein
MGRASNDSRRDAAGDGEALSPPRREPIPLDTVSLLAGIGPGVTLEADPAPAPAGEPAAIVGIEELGRMLRCGESTVRRLIRTAVLRPVEVDGRLGVRLGDVEAYRIRLGTRGSRKPGE